MKFKGQGKINICGFEYKKKIADSRRGGGVRAPKKNPCNRACYGIDHQRLGGTRDTGGSRISLKGGGTGKQFMIVCITKALNCM